MPGPAGSQHEKQQWQQHHHQLLAQIRTLTGHGGAAAQQTRQGQTRDALGDLIEHRRQRHKTLLGRKRRHQVGFDLGQQNDVQDVQTGQHQPWKKGTCVQLHHRHACGGAVDDEHDRRRNQDAQAAAGGNGTGRHPDVIAALEHLRQGQQTHQGDDGTHNAGGRGKDRAGKERGHRKRAGHAGQGQMQAPEELVNQVGPLDQIAHEHEQRNGDEHIVAHHLEGRLHHQGQGLGGIALVGQPREDHAHAHEGEGRGKTQHDGHHHQRQHHQAQMAGGERLGRQQHHAGAGDDERHEDEAEPQLLADLDHRAPPCGAATLTSSALTICLSLSTSTSSTSCSREGHWPSRMH